MKTIALLLAITFVLVSCEGEKEEVKLDNSVIGEEAYRYAMPKDGKFVHPKHGEEKWFAYGAINGVGDTPANGVAQAYNYEDGTSALTVQLNISQAPEGKFYEVWIAGEDPADLASAGHLTNYFGDARHQLSFETNDDLSSRLSVLVTLESDDGEPAPSPLLVAQGTLRPTMR